MIVKPLCFKAIRSSVNTSKKVENCGFPFPCQRPQRIIFFFANRSSGGSSLTARKTGHILIFEDLYKGIPFVSKSKVKWSSLVRNPPFYLNFLYSVPSTISLIFEELGSFLYCWIFVQIPLRSRSVHICCSIETVTKYKLFCFLV